MEYIFLLATPLLTFSGMPQFFRLRRIKKSDEISILTYGMTVVGVGLLAIRSYMVGDISLMAANTASFTMVTINLLTIFYYRRFPGGRGSRKLYSNEMGIINYEELETRRTRNKEPIVRAGYAHQSLQEEFQATITTEQAKRKFTKRFNTKIYDGNK